MSTPNLSTSHLSACDIGYTAPSGRVLVHPLSVEIADGECVAIAGPNGAGKSTLLRMLMGRLPPTHGSIAVAGDALARLSPQERARRIAVLGQAEPAALSMNVGDYVALGRIPWRQHASAADHGEAVKQALAACGLESASQRRLDMLSGGERQRAGLARALAQRPAVLLLDEPTNHLDLRARCDMLDLVRDLGITVVAVLHDLSLLSRFADRVVVMEAGRLVAMDRPKEAMRTELVRRVFQVDAFEMANPRGGSPMLVFDAPARNVTPLRRSVA